MLMLFCPVFSSVANFRKSRKQNSEDGVEYYVSGLGEVINPKKSHKDDERNPPNLHWNLMWGERLGM